MITGYEDVETEHAEEKNANITESNIKK